MNSEWKKHLRVAHTHITPPPKLEVYEFRKKEQILTEYLRSTGSD